MRKFIVLLVAAIFLTAGCASLGEHRKTVIGTLAGAAIGAGTGYAIGKDGKGAGIGAAIGALSGGTVGYVLERQERSFRSALAESEAASIKREQEVLVLSFQSDFWFDFDSGVLKPGAYREIDRVAKILNRYPGSTIRVEGHTDSVGVETYNLELSKRRARAVKNALIAKGVNPSRIGTMGFGEARPVADNNKDEGRQLNRRVEIIIVPVKQA